MDQTLRGYSLVGVLVAMMILMGAMVPLLKLQGRVRGKVHQKNTFYWQSLMERDIMDIQVSKKLVVDRETQLKGRSLFRKVAKAGPNLYKITYTCRESETKSWQYHYWIYHPK